MCAVQHLHTHQHVSDRCLKPHELDAPSGQSLGAGVEDAAFDKGIGQLLRGRLDDVVSLVREVQHDRQAHAGEHGRSPKQLVAPGPDFIDLQIGRPDLVSLRKRQRHHQRRQHTDQRDLDPPPMHRSRSHCGNTSVDAMGD
jgi:hypothetical protein